MKGLITVIGAGLMGSGIAQVLAMADYQVYLIDVDEKILLRSKERITANLEQGIKKGTLNSGDKAAILQRIATFTSLQKAQDSTLIIEAVSEDLKVKGDLFTFLDSICKKETIFASNTSSLSITKLASYTKRPEQFIGMHFMNPVPAMKLVEIIKGLSTGEETLKQIFQLAKELGKEPVFATDYPGFIANRILMPMINEAIFVLMEGVGDASAIDTVMRLGMNHPMGPLELADLIGLDTCLAIMEVLYEGYSDSKYRPSPLLRKMVAGGFLGQKSGEGFYMYG